MQSLSVWEKESFFNDQHVIIIGSGFAGLWSAMHLKLLHPAQKITLLERGIIPTGASTRNAGFSCFGSPSELLGDATLMGEEKMWELLSMRYAGLCEIRNYFSDAEIDYEGSGGFECFKPSSPIWHECYQKLKWLNDGLEKVTGISDVFKIADEKLTDFGFSGFEHLVENKLEGGLHPGKLVQALLRKVQSLGVQVFTSIEVLNYEELNNSVQVYTNHGIIFKTNQLLICTNAFTGKLLPGMDIIPNRGQVLITSPIAGLLLKGTFHFDKGYYYFRNLGNRLLIGGARNMAFDEENTESMHTSPIIQQALESFIKDHLLPNTEFTISDRWSGIMAMGTEKYPIVKAITNNVFCCVRMNGIGVALAPIVAKQVVQLMNT
ncbi:MAG: FAD-dependent oxidoreductase [Ferruginibacter sp.]